MTKYFRYSMSKIFEKKLSLGKFQSAKKVKVLLHASTKFKINRTAIKKNQPDN